MSRNRYSEILIQGNSEGLPWQELALAQVVHAPREEKKIEALFPEPGENRRFETEQVLAGFLYYGQDNFWTLRWSGRKEPGKWNGPPPPTGKAAAEVLMLGIRLPPGMHPRRFDPVGRHWSLGNADGAFVSYGLVHDYPGIGTRYIVFDAIEGSIHCRWDGENLTGTFEAKIPLGPINPSPFDPPGTPDYEPPEFLLATREGRFTFPYPAIPD